MPEFRSRMDLYHWQTPVFADVFANDTTTASDMDKQRLQTRLLDQFATVGLNVEVERAKTMPSYTVYELVSEEALDVDTLREHIYHIETQKHWTIAYSLVDETHFKILLRSQNHNPLTLSQVISRGTFRKAPNLSSLLIGVNLQQQILVSHWEAIKHMLIIGDRPTKEIFIHSMLLTQLMLNTPSELRLAFIGQNLDAYRYLQEAPHGLCDANQANSEQGMRLILGLNRELQRRQMAFESNESSSFDVCNAKRVDKELAIFPRIILILDNLNHNEWIEQQERWFTPLCKILEIGSHYGIHVLLSDWTLDLPSPFDEIRDRMPVRLLTRSFGEKLGLSKQSLELHPSFLRFVDAFFVRGEQWTPLEIATIPSDAVRSLVVYWRQVTHLRSENVALALTQAPADHNSKLDTSERPILPTPTRPSKGALVRATEQLAGVLEADELDLLISANPDETKMTEAHKVITIEAAQEPVVEVIEDGGLSISFDAIQKAQALATYLGWLGTGPLIDILGLSQKEAETIIAILQARQILERSKSPTPHLHVSKRKK